MTQVRQVELLGVEYSVSPAEGPMSKRRCRGLNGKKLVCWLTDLQKVTKDDVIELKDTEGFWIVDKVHEPELDHKEIKRNWHVGGL